MARVIVGYEGRRPVFKDEGPARGRVGAPDSGDIAHRFGVAQMPGRELLEPRGGAATIERRQASDAERDAWRTRGDREQRLVVGALARPAFLGATPDRVQSAHKGGQANRARLEAAKRPQHPWVNSDSVIAARVTEPASPPPREEIAVVEAAQPPPPPDAATVSEEAPRPRLVASVTTPCEDCVHAPVCRIRPELVPDQLLAFVEFEEGVRIAAVSIDCDFYLAVPIEVLARSLKESVAKIEAGTPPPARVPVTEGGRSGRSVAEVTDREQRAANVIETLDRHGGDYTAAGRELGMRPNVVANIARTARRRAMFAGAAPAAVTA